MKRAMLLCLLALALTALAGCGGRADLAFEERYAIDGDLDPAGRTMTYTQRAEITNTGTDETKELWFHLYANMYKGLFQTEDGDVAVTSVTDGAGAPLRYERSQEGVLYWVELAVPLAPGETAVVVFGCEVTIPDLAQKYGVSKAGDLQLPGFNLQLAVYDENGWDTDPLQEEGDGRYARTADYDVTVRAPEGYALACNGDELAVTDLAGVTEYRYRCLDRRDLVLIASKGYVRRERQAGDVRVLGYFDPNTAMVTETAMDQVMDAAAFALQYFGELFGPYPHQTLVVTNAALGTNFAVSMEYSGLITVYFDGDGSTSGKGMVTYHEVAHQWFYAAVGSDENRSPWLDEAFAEFAGYLCLEAAGSDWPCWEIAANAAGAEQVKDDKVDLPADEHPVYQWGVYDRGCLCLKELMDAMGRDAFLAVLRGYCQDHWMGIAATADFTAAVRAAAGPNEAVEDILAKYIQN